MNFKNLFKNLPVIKKAAIVSVAVLLIAVGLFWYFGFGKKTAEKTDLTASINGGLSSADLPNIPEVSPQDQISYNNEIIPLLWTDNNDNENLIIKTDKKYYDASSLVAVYFSVQNQTPNDQQTDIYFWFDSKDKKVESVEKIEDGKISDVRRPEITQSLDVGRQDIARKNINGYTDGSKFTDTISANQINYYKAIIKSPALAGNQQSEFFIEAFGYGNLATSDVRGTSDVKTLAVSAYGHLDPYLTGGLVGYWSFNGQDIDNYTNTAYDRSGSSPAHNGTMLNMATSSRAVSGISGQALSFDGVDDYVNMGDNDIFSPAKITISAWINRSNNNARIVSKDDSSSRDYELKITSTNTIELTLWNQLGTLKTVNGGGVVSAGNWHFITATWDGTTIYTYLDGIKQDSGLLSGTNVNNTIASLQIGGSTFYSEYFLGLIDEVRVYNRALSADEILQLYRTDGARAKVNTPLSGRFLDSSLVGYWSFDGANMGTTSATDLSGNSKIGWLINGVKKIAGINGQGLGFTGTDDYVEVGSVYNGVKTVSFWLKADSNATRKIIDLNSTMYIDVTSGVIATNGFTGTIYVDGVVGSTVDNNWHFVTVTYDAGLNASAVKIGVTAAGCSTPTTGDVMNSGWETGTYSDPAAYGNGWTEVIGAGGVADENFTLIGTPPSGSCLKGLRILTSETPTYSYWDNGSIIDTGTIALDIVFDIYFDAITIGSFGKVSIFTLGNVTDPLSGNVMWINLFNWGGVYMLRAEGGSDATKATITIDKWHTVKIHIDPTSTNSYIQVTGEGASTECDVEGECKFNAVIANDPRYFFFGGSREVDAGEIVDMHFGYVYINTP